MKTRICSVMLLALMGCSESAEQAYDSVSGLPMLIEEDAECFSPTALNGGDLNQIADVAVTGTVRTVAVVDDIDGDVAECDPSSYKWALKLTLEDTYDLKTGSPSSAEVSFLIPSELMGSWNSQPVKSVADEWLPSWASPETQVSASLGWTKAEGIQAGQELAVFLTQTDQGLVVKGLPIGEVLNGQVTTPTNRVSTVCAIVEMLAEPIGITEMVAELAIDPTSAAAPILEVIRRNPTSTRSYCAPEDISNDPRYPEDPDPAIK